MNNKIIVQFPVYVENTLIPFDKDNQEVLQDVIDQLKLDSDEFSTVFMFDFCLYQFYTTSENKYKCYQIASNLTEFEIKNEIIEENSRMINEISRLTKENENLNVENKQRISEDLFLKSLATISGKNL